MAGMMRDPTEPRPQLIDFGRAAPEHAATFLGIMSVLHAEPAAPAFGRLLKKELDVDDYVLLAHLFEEISVLALHRLIPEALLFDAFAFDLYWDELREDVLAVRQRTGNAKFSENFELAAARARLYRRDFPPKLRWPPKPPDDRPPRPPGDRDRGPGDQPRPAPSRRPAETAR